MVNVDSVDVDPNTRCYAKHHLTVSSIVVCNKGLSGSTRLIKYMHSVYALRFKHDTVVAGFENNK